MSASRGLYYEPFLGAGSLFFASSPRRARLSDVNERLIETYEIIRDTPRDALRVLGSWRYGRARYYRLRAIHFKDRIHRAAQFIYLNRTCWNGLYRVNREGCFNVPFGRFHNPTVCNTRVLLEASKALRRASLGVADFEEATHDVKHGDFVYLDPPYSVARENNGFRRYNERLFSWQDQMRLASCARELAARGATVVVSNAYHHSIRRLYPKFYCIVLTRRSLLAADPEKRGKAREVILSSIRLKNVAASVTRERA